MGISQGTPHHQRFALSFFSLTWVCNTHPRSHNRKQKEDTWQRLEVITVTSPKIWVFHCPWHHVPAGAHPSPVHALFSSASFPAPCSPGLLLQVPLPSHLPNLPLTSTPQLSLCSWLSGGAAALSRPGCPHPAPSPFPSLTAPISLTAEGEGQPDPGRGDSAPPTSVHLHPSREDVLGGWLGKNRCGGTGLQHSARHGAENRGAPGLQPLPCF